LVLEIKKKEWKEKKTDKLIEQKDKAIERLGNRIEDLVALKEDVRVKDQEWDSVDIISFQ
jgi:hypothetical protein